MIQYTDDELIEWVIQFYMDNGYWPQLRDMKAPYPGKTTYARRFASAPGKDDGFGVVLVIAQARYAERDAALFEELQEAFDALGGEIATETTGMVKSVVGFVNKGITKFKGWLS